MDNEFDHSLDDFDFSTLGGETDQPAARDADPDREGVELTKRRTQCEDFAKEIELHAERGADAALVQGARVAYQTACESGYAEETLAALERAVESINQPSIAGDAEVFSSSFAAQAEPAVDDPQPQSTPEAPLADRASVSDVEDVDCDQMPRAPGPHPEYRVDRETGATRGATPAQSKIKFTTFPDQKAFAKKEHAATFSQIVEMLRNVKMHKTKATCPWLKLATFGDKRTDKKCLRSNDNVLLVYGLEGDYDDGEVSPADAAERLHEGGVRAVIYTSGNHLRPGKGNRWRVLAPLSQPHAPEERARLMDILNGALGGILNSESWTLSQAYYYGRVEGVEYEVIDVPGDPVDTAALWVAPIGKRGAPTSNDAQRAAREPDIADILTEDQIADLRSALEAIPSDDRGTWVRLGHALVRYGDGGRKLWFDWSAKSEKFNDEDAERVWGSLDGAHTDYGAVFAEAQRLGWTNPKATPTVDEKEVKSLTGERLSPEDFYAYLPEHKYLHRPSSELWPASSVNGNLPKIGKASPAAWLDRNRAVHQMTWWPGRPEIIKDVVIADGGEIDHAGSLVYNKYRAPAILPGDAHAAMMWLEHLARLYPDDHEHIVQWLAQRVQAPHVKVNHALVLQGNQGVGKDTMLAPVKRAIGEWNWTEIAPAEVFAQFNAFLCAVVTRINEARDQGDKGAVNRFAFYDHMKSMIAAPPDTLRINQKYVQPYTVPNLTGVIITTNHGADALYLPADDRRHFVAWSAARKEEFSEEYWARLWGWYSAAGNANVAAYLRGLDISKFDPKAPPPQTEAFHRIVAQGGAGEDSGLADLIERMGNPAAVTLAQLREVAGRLAIDDDAADDSEVLAALSGPKAAKRIGHLMERAGYLAVRNPTEKRGQWKVGGRNVVIYARWELTPRAQLDAARKLAGVS